MQETTQNQSMAAPSKPQTAKHKETIVISVIALVVVGLGVFTGWKMSGGKSSGSSSAAAPGVTVKKDEAGIADESTFSDSATGKLESGGISGEGTHHLIREGGDSQNVYLTSTVIDLESFVGRDVTVWGQTISAQKAGWLMDVGKIKANN